MIDRITFEGTDWVSVAVAVIGIGVTIVLALRREDRQRTIWLVGGGILTSIIFIVVLIFIPPQNGPSPQGRLSGRPPNVSHVGCIQGTAWRWVLDGRDFSWPSIVFHGPFDGTPFSSKRNNQGEHTELVWKTDARKAAEANRTYKIKFTANGSQGERKNFNWNVTLNKPSKSCQ